MTVPISTAVWQRLWESVAQNGQPSAEPQSPHGLLLLDELDRWPSIGLTYNDLEQFRGVCNNHPGLKIVAVSRKPLKAVFPYPGYGSEAYNFSCQ